MLKPAQTLADIMTLASSVLEDETLDQQLKPLVQHIHNSAQELHKLVLYIPSTEHAVKMIIPALGDSFAKPQSAIFGYAKLLTEMAAANQADLTAQQQEQLTNIYNNGVALLKFTEELTAEMLEERKTMRDAPPIIFNINMLIWNNIPVYRYWLRDTAVRVTANFSSGLPPVHGNPYHITAIAEHIVKTIGCELLEYGKIQISGNLRDDKQAFRLTFFCTGIQFNRTEQDILFQQQGRNIYYKRIKAENAEVHYSHEQGIGASLHLDLPLPPRATASQDDLSG